MAATPSTDPVASGGAAGVPVLRRGRRANTRVVPNHLLPAGNNSEGQHVVVPHTPDALGGDGEAQGGPDAPESRALAVVNTDPAVETPVGARKRRGQRATNAVPPIASMPAGNNPEGHWCLGTQVGTAFGGDGGAQLFSATQVACSPAVAEIVQLWRMRQRWHRAEKALILQGRAACRGLTEGDKAAANRMFDAAAKGQAVEPAAAIVLAPFLGAIASFAPERAAIEKRLRVLARAQALWLWVAQVRGFGDLNLAGLIGEAGEIAAYRNPSCLWKRMGLAVIDGGRQRMVPSAEGAALHGYNPRRRTVAYLLGDTLIKAGGGNLYRPVYTERRLRTAETHPDWTKAHSHNDAARVMVKRVLRDLWCEARRLAPAEAGEAA